jgi:hypothetical protein
MFDTAGYDDKLARPQLDSPPALSRFRDLADVAALAVVVVSDGAALLWGGVLK